MYEQFQNIMKMGPFSQIMVSVFVVRGSWIIEMQRVLEYDSRLWSWIHDERQRKGVGRSAEEADDDYGLDERWW